MDSIDLRLKDKKMQSDKDKIKEREEKMLKQWKEILLYKEC